MAAAASGYNFNHQTAQSKDEEMDGNGKGCYRDWDTVQVSQWLTNQIKLPQYSEMFKEIGIDGQIIDHVTDADLEQDFGIKVRLHRVKIIEGIKRLQVAERSSETAGATSPSLPPGNAPGVQNQFPIPSGSSQPSSQPMPAATQHPQAPLPAPLNDNNPRPYQQPDVPQMQQPLQQVQPPMQQPPMQMVQAVGQQQVQQQPQHQQRQQQPLASNAQQQAQQQAAAPLQQQQRAQANVTPPSSSAGHSNPSGAAGGDAVMSNAGPQSSQPGQAQQFASAQNVPQQQPQPQRQPGGNQDQQQQPQFSSQHQSNILPQAQGQMQRIEQRADRVDTPPHSNQRNGGGLNSSGENNAASNFANASQQSEGMHVFVNSQGAGLAVNGGKFVAASQQYLQELAKNQSEYQSSELQQNDILVLKAVEGQLLNNVYIIGDNGAALGRHSASNDMVISESFVSRRHCEIKYVDSGSGERNAPSNDGDLTNFYLRDIGSTTGTFIMVRQEVAFTSNMMFQMGLSEFKVVTTSKPTMCELHVFEGPARNRMVPVDEMGLTIGRDQQNTFCVQEDSQMSNYHAKISYKAGGGSSGSSQRGFYLTDVGSTNRTWLRLSAEGEQSTLHPLKVGDILKIGSTVFVVESSDIHNLKYMPVINKRAQNGASQGFQPGAGGAMGGSDVDSDAVVGSGIPVQIGAGVGQVPESEADELLLDEEEEKREIEQQHNQQVLASQQPSLAPGQQQIPNLYSSSEMCKLCYEAECDAAFIPCGHVTACTKCAGRCQQCPVCRLPYHDIMKLYRQ